MFLCQKLKFSKEETYFIVEGNFFVSIKLKAYFKLIQGKVNVLYLFVLGSFNEALLFRHVCYLIMLVNLS